MRAYAVIHFKSEIQRPSSHLKCTSKHFNVKCLGGIIRLWSSGRSLGPATRKKKGPPFREESRPPCRCSPACLPVCLPACQPTSLSLEDWFIFISTLALVSKPSFSELAVASLPELPKASFSELAVASLPELPKGNSGGHDSYIFVRNCFDPYALPPRKSAGCKMR